MLQHVGILHFFYGCSPFRAHAPKFVYLVTLTIHVRTVRRARRFPTSSLSSKSTMVLGEGAIPFWILQLRKLKLGRQGANR